MSLGRLGSYDLLEWIGEGGMGVVFRAHDVRLDRQVAVKVLSERHALDAEYRARLLREARAEARLNHPNIAACYDVGEATPEPASLLAPESPGTPPASVVFLAMEFVPGTDLDELIRGRPLPLARVLDLATQIASGLEAAHAAGLVHRDLKPGNVRITPEGRAKILDFGLARHGSAPLSDSTESLRSPYSRDSGTIVGTVLYMAPEQASGQPVDARADLFSFGVVLYEMVTGRRPFGGDDMVTAMYALANEHPAPLARFASGVPAELERIVGKLLEKRPAHRYQSAHEVLTDLQRLAAEGGNAPARRRWSPRGRTWTVAAGVALAVCAAIWLAGRAGPGRHGGAPSLAVLGFENATGDSSLGYLCAGLAADLEGDLVQDSRLNVASAAEVGLLARDQRSPRSAARRLGVQSVLTGALRRLGGATRLQVELVDGRTGFVNWSAGYDLAPGQVYQLKRQIASAVSSSLGTRRVDSVARARRDTAPQPAAYEEYLHGVEALGDMDDPLAPRRAVESLDRAVALAPGFALAWAARSRALAWRYDHERDPALMTEAERSANRALAIDPDLVPARVARARVYRLTGRQPQAIADLDAVLRVNPNWDDAWVALAGACRQSGDLVRAEACLRQAVALRPGYPSNWHALGNLMLRLGRHADASAAYQRVIDLAPDQNVGYAGLASVNVLKGDFRAAAAVYAKLPRGVTDAALASNMATSFFFAGRLDEALRSYLLAVSLEPRNAMLRSNLGDCDQRMGRSGEARAQYRMAVKLGESDLVVSPDDPGMLAQHAMHLAKAGDCARAWAAYEAHPTLVTTRDAEVQHALAKAFALCGHRTEAVAALRRMAAMGAATDLLNSEDEFASLRADPAFRALLRTPAR